MRSLAFLAALLAALLVPCASVGAAELSIMPVAVHLDKARDRTTVQVTNNGTTPVLLQADAIGWRREGGGDRDEPSEDLIVNPGVFTLAPGKTQVVRVGLRRNTASEAE